MGLWPGFSRARRSCPRTWTKRQLARRSRNFYQETLQETEKAGLLEQLSQARPDALDIKIQLRQPTSPGKEAEKLLRRLALQLERGNQKRSLAQFWPNRGAGRKRRAEVRRKGLERGPTDGAGSAATLAALGRLAMYREISHSPKVLQVLVATDV